MKGRQEARSIVIIDRLDILPVNDYVLIKVDRSPYLKLSSGIVLGDVESINEEYRMFMPAEHAIRHGEVVAFPNKETITNYVFTSPIDILVGDLVWFDYQTGIYAPLLMYENQYLYMVKYESLIVRKRGDSIVTLNGNLLCDTYTKATGQLDISSSKEVKNMVVITHVGLPVVYKHHADNDHIKKGDVVMTNEIVYMLESDMHLFLDGKKHRVVERKDLYAQWIENRNL